MRLSITHRIGATQSTIRKIIAFRQSQSLMLLPATMYGGGYSRKRHNASIETPLKKVKANQNDLVYTKTAGSTIIHWFRTDLRINDNTAFFTANESAARRNLPLVALWIISPGEWKGHRVAAIKVDFWLRTLSSLATQLSKLNISLLIKYAETKHDIITTIKETCAEFQAKELYFNKEYEVNESRRDALVEQELPSMGVEVFGHHDQCVVPPGIIKTKEGKDYTVFTPFKNNWIAHLERNRHILNLKSTPSPAIALPEHLAKLAAQYTTIPTSLNGFTLDKAKLELAHITFPASEAHADSRLANFMNQNIQFYADHRDICHKSATSTLSPYLTSGLISARKCIAEAIKMNGDKLTMNSPSKTGPGTWISELCWRDFYRNVMVAFPRVSMNRAFKPESENIEWCDDEVGFRAWCEGKTGYPIVDAGMRQLNKTGWMHNRARMIVASFLAKDLLINWKLGENYFHENLIDGDLANNNGGWQWSAGTGTDAQPYFRIFNPTTQSEKFDTEGKYIKQYVPELASLTGKAIHDPYAALGAKGVEKLGYVKPIVDHKVARDRALAAYSKAMKKKI